jgi:hypothetical protein
MACWGWVEGRSVVQDQRCAGEESAEEYIPHGPSDLGSVGSEIGNRLTQWLLTFE